MFFDHIHAFRIGFFKFCSRKRKLLFSRRSNGPSSICKYSSKCFAPKRGAVYSWSFWILEFQIKETTIQAAQDNLVGPYGQCFMSLANKHDLSIDKETGSQDILNSTCNCQRPIFSDENEIGIEADSAIKKAQEEVLSSQIRGTLLGQFNNLLFLSELISEGSSNASITALAPNCRIGKIFDSLEALSKRDDCKGKGDVFKRRFEQIFGSSDFKVAKENFNDLIEPFLKNKKDEKTCLPYRDYIRLFNTKDMASPVKTGLKSGLSYGLKFMEMDKKYGKSYTQEDAAYYSDMIFHIHNLSGSDQGPPVNISEVSDEHKAGKIQETLTFIDWNASMGFNLNVDRMQDDSVDPLLSMIMNNRKLKHKYKKAIEEAVCEDERRESPTPATFECRKLKYADLPNLKKYSSNFFKNAIMKGELLGELGNQMNEKCRKLTGIEVNQEDGSTAIEGSVGKFLCDEELEKPSYPVFKTQILPKLAGKVDSGEMALYSVEYFKNNFCEKDPASDNFKYPDKNYASAIERVVDPIKF